MRKGFDGLLPVLLRECRLINRAATRIDGGLEPSNPTPPSSYRSIP